MISHPFALLAFMFLIVAFARFLEGQFDFIKKISSAVVCTLLGIMLANLGVIPHASSIHEGVYDFAVPYAIVLIILSAHLGDLRRAGKRLVIGYLLAAGGSFIGAFLASLAFHRWLGPETWKLGGTFTAAFVGGGMNFAAVGRGLELPSGLFAGAFVADNLSTVPWLLAQVGLFTLLAPYYRQPSRPTAATAEHSTPPPEDPRRHWTSTSVSITDLAFLAALPLGALWVSRQLSLLVPGFPEVLWLTTLALIAGQVPFARRLKGAAVFAYFSLHLFFIVIGATSDVGEVLKAGPAIFLYMILILTIHGLIVYLGGWLLRIDLATICVASQAAVGGPGSALAISMAMKWGNLATPGIIIGIFGYAVGNYFGFACAYLLLSVL